MTAARLDGMPNAPEDLLRDLAPDGTGIVGNRHLVTVQTIDIARLTTHPVPLIPGTFVVVTGQGPKGDSNGSGKTSFESAVSLLLGDAQWRLEGNGAVAAAGLLFKPESAGLDPSHRYPPADRGYVIGVFAHPQAPEQTALTVWVKIAAISPYLRVRWTHGLHAPTGDSDAERYAEADRLWETLPRVSEIGPKTMARDLYGAAPRCMAYLDTTLRKTGPSLLSQQMTELDPDRIGEALIELTGRADLLESEQEQRGKLADQKQQLAGRETGDARARLDEQTDLDAVRHRNAAREHLARGERLWRLHFAKGLADVAARTIDLDADIEALTAAEADAEAEREVAQADMDALQAVTDPQQAQRDAKYEFEQAQALYNEKAGQLADVRRDLSRIATRRAELQPVADGWTGLSVAAAEEATATAIAKKVASAVAVERARQDKDQARNEFEQVSAGGGGTVGAALDALTRAGVRAVGLLDALSLDEAARTVWEPRLWPYRDAVCIGAEDEPAAAEVLVAAGLPGSLIVTADGALDEPAGEEAAGRPIVGGVRGGVPVVGFLTALADTLQPLTDPDRSRHPQIGDSVLGGFTAPIAGRAARIAAAQEILELAEQLRALAEADDRAAQLGLDAAQDAEAAACAVAELAGLDTEQGDAQQQLAGIEPVVARLNGELSAAQEKVIAAGVAAASHEQRIQLAEATLNGKDRALNTAREKLGDRRNDRAVLDYDYWADGWGLGIDAAHTLLDEQDGPLRGLTHVTYRNRAAEALNDALRAYVGGGDELPPELAESRPMRERLTDESGRVGRGTVPFSVVAQPLRDLLDAREEMDLILEDRILRGQAERANQIEALRSETSSLDETLHKLQDAISNRVETALRSISSALDGLNRGRGGFGAELRIVETRPTSPTAPWKWEVTPRWRRSATGGMVSYKEVANGAQVKQVAIQLVLAALLAHEGAQGRVLILDELGNSLGDVNRKQVLADLHEVAAQQNVTILGTCQDSVLADAAGVCGQILWFSHHSHADAYNQPTRMWGFDANGNRVEMLADWLIAGRGLV